MKKKKWIAAVAVLLFIAAAVFYFRSTGKTSVQEAESIASPAQEAGPAGENGADKPSGAPEKVLLTTSILGRITGRMKKTGIRLPKKSRRVRPEIRKKRILFRKRS